jgi:hypothetical protein
MIFTNKIQFMIRVFAVLVLFVISGTCPAQYKWKLEKQKNGISVYLSDVEKTNFKAVKVECAIAGTFAKLVGLLSNVSQFNSWIYKNKMSKIIRQNTPLDFIYYSETYMPWPLTNRDAIIHLKINTDSLPRFLTISGKGEPDFLSRISNKVRVPHFKANWKVTMPTSNTIHITYVLEIDPGGNIPAWVSNSFADKGPYETFLNISEHLKR